MLPYSGDDATIWTDKPVRIDRATQDYERIPGPADHYLSGFRVKPRTSFFDGMSFTMDGSVYLLRDVIAPDPKRLCKADDGRRFVCGAQARALLRSTIFGRYLECDTEVLSKYVKLVSCRVGTNSVAEQLVGSGFARAISSAELKTLQQKAILQRAGVWADPLCRASLNC
ncbi:hypothetical protein J5J10_20855 [Ciceribacter sp. L1K23]|uniref:thermonuclease family protein n=1 Tax=Ciceribacter sp. L1K23 TaxID=2820276 RepID=UPI001B8148C0|nr:hypothetical protein [Ciceribacter sp. L1K23]MBR0558150.1 hypothetical protein [Ciceribacter sp. L1K23]